MWAALIVTAITSAATAFMLRFLIALLREGAPSVCYWVVPVRRKPEREIVGVLRSDDIDDDGTALGHIHRECHLELLENDNYAKEECSSGLIVLDVRPVSAGSVWRSIYQNNGYGVREHRL
jgi:hypothetical protein